MNNTIPRLILDCAVAFLQSTVATSTLLNQKIYCTINFLRALRVVARQPEEVLLGCDILAYS